MARSNAASRRGTLQVTKDTTVIDPEYHTRAHEVVYESMFATRVGTIKIDPRIAALMFSKDKVDPKKVEDARKDLETLMAGRPFAIYADRIIYLEAEGELRRRSAEMVIDRVNPLPNRVDSARKTKYKILRIDPNRREATLEEIPATASIPDEPL